jgi:cation transport ATPase
VAQATDLARLTADVVLLSSDLGRLAWLFAHAQRVVRIARQNLVWAFGYNVTAIALAAAGRLNPIVASLAMIGSSLGVIANARRINRM